MTRLAEKYNFNREINDPRIKREKIILPVQKNDQSTPDFDFMRAYMAEIFTNKISHYNNYLENILSKLTHKKVLPLQEKSWAEFSIDYLFNVIIGANVDGNKIDTQSGTFAYITRKESDNGLDGFINAEPKKFNNIYPVITIGNETAQPYVQKYPFFTGTKVNIMIPKHNLMSDKVLFFIVTSLRQQKIKFNYSYTINSTRLRKQNILLPIDKSGEPDFDYMDQYIKNIFINKYKQYLDA